jgi:hypothetical protein
MKNSELVGKFIIVKDLQFSDFMKDEKGEIEVYDTLEQAAVTCGMYEFPDVLIMQVVFNHVEDIEDEEF